MLAINRRRIKMMSISNYNFINFSILFENGYFHLVENLKTYSRFLFEICSKIVLGALESSLSIYAQ